AGMEGVAERAQAIAQLHEVVDLAVAHHVDRAVLVGERLVTTGEVDDRETAVSQRAGSVAPYPLVVGAAQAHGVVDRGELGGGGGRTVADPERAGDAAHARQPLALAPPAATPDAATLATLAMTGRRRCGSSTFPSLYSSRTT